MSYIVYERPEELTTTAEEVSRQKKFLGIFSNKRSFIKVEDRGPVEKFNVKWSALGAK